MKTKLTLTVQKSVIEAARKRSRRSGKSISGLFEEVFERNEHNHIQSEPQRAAVRLLKLLKTAAIKDTQADKELLKKHIEKKYA